MSKKKEIVVVIREFKEYVPKPHPRQDDIDAFRKTPSLYTGGRR